MVEEAVDPGDLSLLDDLVKQAEEYDRRQAAAVGHGFVQWLEALQDGWASLPERIPRDVLLAWRNGHAYHPAGASPIPVWRCQSCKMVLPNSDPTGHVMYFERCPVCGSGELAYMDLSRPWGAAWILADGSAEAAA